MADLGDDGAAAVRARWRDEEEQWSRAAFERWEHGRALVDVVRDCMRRGDVVTFAFPAHQWSGPVLAVGDDSARIGDTPGVDVRLAIDAPFVLRVHAEGGDHEVGDGGIGDGAVATFLARLRELDGTDVGIGTSAASLEGTLRVGRDQLRVTDRDGQRAYVPTGSVWWSPERSAHAAPVHGERQRTRSQAPSA